MAKKHKYILTIEFESEKPVVKFSDKDGVQFENGLGYFVDTPAKRPFSSINTSFVYGSGKTKLRKAK